MEMWVRRYRHLDRPYLEFVQSRWWRLAPVLFVCTAASAIVYGSGWIQGDARALGSPGWWMTQPIIVGSTYFGRLLPPVWSLDVEMQFYLVAPWVILLLSKSTATVATAITVALIGWNCVQAACGRIGETSRIDLWLGFFMTGMIASHFDWRPRTIVAMTWLAAGAVLIGLIVLTPQLRGMIVLRGRDGNPPSGWLPAIAFLAILGTAVPFVLWSVRIPSTKFDRLLGDWSYPLYLIHWLPRDWYYTQLHAGNGVVLPLTINFAASFLIAFAILIYIDRPCQRWRNRWMNSHDRRVPTPDVLPETPASLFPRPTKK